MTTARSNNGQYRHPYAFERKRGNGAGDNEGYHDADYDLGLIIRIDPEFQALIPPLSGDEREALEASLLAEGCRDALVAWGEVLVDGHNRYAICQEHGIPFEVRQRQFESREDAVVWIIQNQFARRNITAFVRAELALKLKDVIAVKAKANMAAGGGDKKSGFQNFGNPVTTPIHTDKELAKVADVSHETIRKVETVTTKAPEPIREKARQGELSVDRAYRLTKALDAAAPEVQAAAIEHGAVDPQLVTLMNDKKHTETVRALLASGCLQPGDESEAIPMREASAWDLQGVLRRAEQEHRAAAADARKEAKFAQIAGQPGDVYSVIYADPPWQYSNTGVNGAAEKHYPTLPTENIASLPLTLGLKTASDSVLFLWATNPLLPDALRVIEAWGFTYKTNLVWVKDGLGVGFYTRGRHELLLIATRGSFLPAYQPDSVLPYAKSEHSEKPGAVYGLIETMYPGQRYVELFARCPETRDHWTFWGNEA